MTENDVTKLVREIARDLRLDPAQRYELGTAARAWLGKPDADVRREAHAAASQARNSLVGGALNLLATAMCETRFMESLSATERSSYEGRLYGTTASGLESVDVNVEDALADAAAHEAAGRTGHAQQIRTAVERHRSARPAPDGSDEG